MLYFHSVREIIMFDNQYETFTKIIAELSRSVGKIKNREMEKFGLKGKQVQCFFCLYKNPEGVSFKDLCTFTGTDKAATWRTVKELESRGYVYTHTEQGRKYKNPVKLTEKGRSTGIEIDRIICGIVDAVSGDIPEEEREKMYRLLYIINDNLKKICDRYGE